MSGERGFYRNGGGRGGGGFHHPAPGGQGGHRGLPWGNRGGYHPHHQVMNERSNRFGGGGPFRGDSRGRGGSAYRYQPYSSSNQQARSTSTPTNRQSTSTPTNRHRRRNKNEKEKKASLKLQSQLIDANLLTRCYLNSSAKVMISPSLRDEKSLNYRGKKLNCTVTRVLQFCCKIAFKLSFLEINRICYVSKQVMAEIMRMNHIHSDDDLDLPILNRLVLSNEEISENNFVTALVEPSNDINESRYEYVSSSPTINHTSTANNFSRIPRKPAFLGNKNKTSTHSNKGIRKKTEICTCCKKKMQPNFMLTAAKSNNPNNVMNSTSVKKGNQSICNNCHVLLFQFLKEKTRYKNLITVMHTTFLHQKSPPRWEIQNSTEVPVRQMIMDSVFCNHATESSGLEPEMILRKLPNNLVITVLNLRKQLLNKTSLKYYQENISGIRFNNDDDIDLFCNSVLDVPPSSYGIILLPDEDFIIMSSIGICDNDIYHISESETNRIIEMPFQGRTGAAGGIVYPRLTKCSSLSKTTLKDSSIFLPANRGVGVSVTYQSDDKERDETITTFNGVYNNILMRKLTKRDKYKLINQSSSYKRLYLEEMYSRMISLCIVSKLDLITDDVFAQSLKFMKTDFENEMNTKKKKKMIPPRAQVSLLESSLLKLCCTTGETRNHSAVAAHCDGNKSHFLETLTLFGRSTTIETKEKCHSYKPGYLFLPLLGVCIKMNCGKTLINCKLKNTIHIPDPSRNLYNWSKVHGPSGTKANALRDVNKLFDK